ncbi:hypothetical protein PIB30_012766 [Stylosanthes scabra]|uniref:Uncharacterized protein n=1 Tax=Stylosanthes scabra TaxID=79078 RepID=A0ABU6S6M1_9FABA|nr:hypothetical protein [Stylosanthes scabra]
MRLSKESTSSRMSNGMTFVEWILSIGDGLIGDNVDGESIVKIPSELLLSGEEKGMHNLVSFVEVTESERTPARRNSTIWRRQLLQIAPAAVTAHSSLHVARRTQATAASTLAPSTASTVHARTSLRRQPLTLPPPTFRRCLQPVLTHQQPLPSSSSCCSSAATRFCRLFFYFVLLTHHCQALPSSSSSPGSAFSLIQPPSFQFLKPTVVAGLAADQSSPTLCLHYEGGQGFIGFGGYLVPSLNDNPA